MADKNSFTIEHQQQEKAIDTVKDWSKVLIGLNFAAGTGCILVLQQGVSALVKSYLAGAVVFFALSSLFSALIIVALPSIIQRLPLKSHPGKFFNIYDFSFYAPWMTLKTLTILQCSTFTIGLLCLLTWIFLKPPIA